MEKLHFFSALLLSSFLAIYCVDWNVVTPLDRYVHHDDKHFKWEEVASYNYEDCTVYIINMTSQLYQTDEYSTRSVWWHYMGVAIPDKLVYHDAGILMITGGGNENYNPPEREELETRGISLIARDTGLITAYIKQVPNQPMYFHDDPDFRRRTEDSLIAWTWRSYLNMSPDKKNRTVAARMPMTKAGKRGLDTIKEVAARKLPGTNIDRFIVAGASKRGWTAWSVAATDPRVIAVIPLVFSLINMDEATINHNRNMNGDWSFALSPYWRENLTQEFVNPEREGIWESEDMYNYKERFTMPVMAMSSSGDEFFLPDDNHNWWDDFPNGKKYLLMLPNAEHTMAPHYPKVVETAVSFSLMVLEDIPMPKMSWTMGNTATGGYIKLTTDTTPNTIRAWRAVTNNNGRRDFRLAAGQPARPQLIPWRSEEVDDLGNGEYYFETDIVENRWVGFFIECIFDGIPGLYEYRLALTTQVNIIPWTYPAPACTDAASCWGKLV